MSDRGLMMWRTAGCCGGGDAEVTQISIDDRGSTVGIVGLKRVFQQLYMIGREPEVNVGDELLSMVKTRNHIPPLAEERYKSALLQEYTAFCMPKGTG
jgi:hypothetical protein